MPITIEKHESGKYFVSTLVGTISDKELLAAYTTFYQSDEWTPGLHELTDLSRASLTEVSWTGLVSLASWEQTFLSRHGVVSKKTALYVPHGRSRSQLVIYDVWTAGSPEHVRIFDSWDAGIRWLTEEDAVPSGSQGA